MGQESDACTGSQRYLSTPMCRTTLEEGCTNGLSKASNEGRVGSRPQDMGAGGSDATSKCKEPKNFRGGARQQPTLSAVAQTGYNTEGGTLSTAPCAPPTRRLREEGHRPVQLVTADLFSWSRQAKGGALLEYGILASP
jgi:hypothetical protein